MAQPSQIRAARALLGWTQKQLAEAVGVSTMTIKRAEGSGTPPVPPEMASEIRKVMEVQGVVFIPENGGGPGVRMKSPSR